jgi:hypothetical protein
MSAESPRAIPRVSGELVAGVMGLLARYHGPRDVNGDEWFVELLLERLGQLERAYRDELRPVEPDELLEVIRLRPGQTGFDSIS